MRFIDADAFRRELINRQITTQFFNPRERHEIGCIVEMFDNAPTVDIKTEVAREIFAEIEKLKSTKYDYNDYVEWEAIAELKNKYTGGVRE